VQLKAFKGEKSHVMSWNLLDVMCPIGSIQFIKWDHQFPFFYVWNHSNHMRCASITKNFGGGNAHMCCHCYKAPKLHYPETQTPSHHVKQMEARSKKNTTNFFTIPSSRIFQDYLLLHMLFHVWRIENVELKINFAG